MEIHNITPWCLLVLFLWLNSEACIEEERAALLEIKSSINCPEGTSLSNWYGEDCCLWEGLECNVSTSRVVKIFLRYSRDSSLPPWHLNTTSFSQFKDLQLLELPGNQINGFTSPQGLSNLKSLQGLNLQDNVIEDGSNLCWGKLPSLSLLDVSYNRLKGNFPECLCDNLFMKVLRLSKNDLGGHISPCFSNLTLVEHVDLSDNHFSGSFPSSLIQNLTNIESFIVSENQFEGTISFSVFANLSSLKYLDMSQNRLKVKTDGPNLSLSFKLNGLKLSGCNLTNIPSFLSAQDNLQVLDLSYNLLPSVPSWLLHNVTEELWIRGNSLSGTFAGLLHSNSSQLTVLDISNNSFYGSLPVDIGLALPMVHYLDVSENSFSGTLPQSLGTMKQLRELKLFSNRFTGKIPDKLTTNMSFLELLDLSENNLSGALPWNTSLPNLRCLKLDRNHFGGTFPNSLSESNNLLVVSIRDNALSGKLSSDFPCLPQLRILLLGGNRLEGQIPRQVCQMRHLRAVDLSENRLSGDIPRCLSNVSSWIEETYDDNFNWRYSTRLDFRIKGELYTIRSPYLSFLTGIDVSCNQFTGVIPAEISQMKHIKVLNMSYNILRGQIPASFGDLVNVESLDLSYNKLTGQLPRELINLSFLSTFNVSFNNLSGSIPAENQFSTFDRYSYLGNPGLCGGPLSRNCREVEEGVNNSSSFNASFNNLSGSIPAEHQFSTFDRSSYLGNPRLCGGPLSRNCSEVEEGVNNSSSFSPDVDGTPMYAQLLFCWCVLFILCPLNLPYV